MNNHHPKKLLFITWDSDSTNYLESLFLPILQGLQESGIVSCAILQFSWAAPDKIKQLKSLSEAQDIAYWHYPISRKPHPLLGSLWTVYKGRKIIKKLIKQEGFQLLMPRSTMPAMMVNRLWRVLKRKEVKVLFDADGLPLEERLDFTALKSNDFQYKYLKRQETQMLQKANKVLCRTQKAIDFHIPKVGESRRRDFHWVSNGRDADRFTFSTQDRERVRQALGIRETEKLWVYTGSLGPQYALKEMLGIFELYQTKQPNSRFLILVNHKEHLGHAIPKGLKDKLIFRSLPFQEIPAHLSAADIAFSLRLPAWSMRGVAPIKLGEYLLMGLPVIASTGIGDTEILLQGLPFVHLYYHREKDRKERAVEWVKDLSTVDRQEIRDFALAHFSLNKSIAEYSKVINESLKE
ncbi:hypothetical protein KZP23_14875 [Echinicola marina]|uniref:hypothetical protein n=1 Tax=Echinicola marina TaxID=2859768 RepID=UPI001CF678D4|nr:hypothetical protein [Echinicola marina]UCS92001.1 hypothetical protein KZP23_14875 [Echinicola marina]